MKSNALFVITIFALLSSLLFWQVKNVAALNIVHPLTSPITSPVSPSPTPSTPPITFPQPTPTSTPTATPTSTPSPAPSETPVPVEEHRLSGRVEYQFTFHFFRKQYEFKFPAVGVHVVAVNNLKPFGYQADTDFSGRFKFKLPEGQYSVAVYDGQGTRFEPGVVIVNLDKNYNNINFMSIR